ncbi:uncharacterized protein LOC127711635 [Mytilus californianus]|uniref:uncharacterized protein LOC127711635 n=1 Tax=Mytilus californianus TaxID=6549 RepID=UPI0022470C42|nr:uncharacterized protein LOC127711635 [Mytilus californianus]
MLPSLLMWISCFGHLQTQLVTLRLLEEPVQFGQMLRLSCVAQSKTVYDLNGVTWYKQSENGRIILVNNKQSFFKSKYKDVHGEEDFERVLKISTINASDVSANYSCEFGLHEAWINLSLNTIDIAYYPTGDDIHVTTSFDNTYSFIYVNVLIRKVYPVIRSCWHVLNARNYSLEESLKISEKGIFFGVEFDRKIPLHGPGKEYVVAIICSIGNHNVKIFQKSHSIESCKDIDEGIDALFDTGFILGILSGIAPCVFFVMLGLYIKKKCSKNKYKVCKQPNEVNEDTYETTDL